MQDALAAVHDSQLIHAHQLLTELLVVERMGNLAPTGFSCVVAVDSFLAQCFRQFLQRGALFAAQEDYAVHIAYNGVAVVLVQRFQLTLRLQDQASGDLTAAYGGDQLFQLGNLADVGAFVDQAAHMHRKPPAVHVIRLFAQEVEKLGIAHGQQEVERIIRIGHDHEQRRFTISQSIQFQLVIGSQVAQLLNIEGSEARAAGNQNGFCCLA